MHFPASAQLNRVMTLTVTVVVVGMSTGALAQQRVQSDAISQTNISQTNTSVTDAPTTNRTPVTLPDAITLGQPCNHPYVVAIPQPDEALLDRVQTIVGAAFITESRLGPYVQAGASPRRRPAEQVSRQLRRAGFDARVIYRPIACGS